MKIEAGKLYQMNDGTIRYATPSVATNTIGCFDLEGFTFKPNGQPIYPDAHKVRVLYKLRVNEHMEPIHISVQEAPDAAEKAREQLDALRKSISEMPAGPCRNTMLGILMQHEKKPFRLSGPGWYKHRDGSWRKINEAMLGKMLRTHRSLPGWSGIEDIIARATDAQAKILDGL